MSLVFELNASPSHQNSIFKMCFEPSLHVLQPSLHLQELMLTPKPSRQEQQLKHDDAKTKQRSAEQDIQKQADA